MTLISLLQALLGILGLCGSLFPIFTDRGRKILLAIFSIISLLQVYLTSVQNKENQKLLDNITGGDSFPVVIPQTHGGVPISLTIWNRGKSILCCYHNKERARFSLLSG